MRVNYFLRQDLRSLSLNHLGILFLGILMFLSTGYPALASAPIGWAAVPGMGVDSTIGGGGGPIVTAESAEELRTLAGKNEPLMILVNGTLTGDGRIDVASNKTILGVGSKATLNNAGLHLTQVSNVIIRNLTIKKSVDGIALRQSHHVWVDHCDLTECGDGLLDITHASDYVTVSWTRFSNHHKTMLINSGTSQPEDAGYLKTTIHHCWFDGSITRNPRVGYGLAHIFNCLYNGNGYGIGLHSQARVLLEHNHFEKVNDPVKQMYRMNPSSPHHGFCEGVENIFQNCNGRQDIDGISFPVEKYYMHDFMLDAVSDVPTIARKKVGPKEAFGTLTPQPIPGNGAISVSIQPELKWTGGPDATGYTVSFGESNPPSNPVETKSRALTPRSLQPGTVYYWRVDQTTTEGMIEGDVWRFRTAPSKAWFEKPENLATEGDSEVALDWQSGAGATAHCLFFARQGDPLKFVAEVKETPYKMKNLHYGTTYRWRVDPVVDQGVIQGDEWIFTTKNDFQAAPGRVEAESMTLGGGYLIESISDASGGHVAAMNHRNGWMLHTHQGEDGFYEITVSYFDNEDGLSQFHLLVNGDMISEWKSNEGNNNGKFRTQTFSNLLIKKNDEIRIVGTWLNGDHLARVDWVETKSESR